MDDGTMATTILVDVSAAAILAAVVPIKIFRRKESTMVREICKDEAFLAQKAEPATPDDLDVAQDLLETLVAHKES